MLHEFSTVPGVKEDVTDLILNIKDLVVSSEHDEPVVMYLRKQGPGEVTAADIAPPAGVEVHNPDLHIATLNGKGKLEIELTVERGRGYVSAAQNKQPGQEIGRIPIDSIYSPVPKVTYKVEATRVEQRTDFDRLVLDVETKSSIRPRDAVARAGHDPGRAVRPGPRAQRRRRGHRHRPVADRRGADGATWRCRSRSWTSRSARTTASSARASTRSASSSRAARPDLLDIRNFGAKSIDEVKGKLADLGLALKDCPPGFDPSAAVDNYAADEDDSYVETEQY